MGADGLAETTTVVQILEQRAVDNTAGLKAARQTLDDLGTASAKLSEDYMMTKALAAELQAEAKKTASTLRSQGDNLERTNSRLGSAQSKLDKQGEYVDGLRSNFEQLQSKVQALREGQESTNKQLGLLHS